MRKLFWQVTRYAAIALLAASCLAVCAVPVWGAIVQRTRTNNSNFFVDGSSNTSSVTFGAGTVASQVLEVRASVRFMKADGQAYGVNNGGTPYYDEIDFRLTSPSGTTANLISPDDFLTGAGTGGFGFGQIHFRPGSGYDFVNDDPTEPQTGNYRPTGDLRSVENETAAGTWTLFFEDTVALDGLSIDRFRLRIWSGDPDATVSGITTFGNVLVGSTANQTISVSNTGDSRPITNDGTVVSTLLSGTLNDPVGSGNFTGLGAAAFANVIVGGPTADRTYQFSPTSRSPSSATVQITTDGGNESLALTGQGVAPQASIDTSAADAGQVRLGDTANATVVLTNVGDGNLSGLGAVSNLNGSLSTATGDFSGGGSSFSLTDAASTSAVFSFAPTARGSQTHDVTLDLTNGSPDGTNSAVTQPVTLAGEGVGPEFTSTGDVAGLLDFGSGNVGETVTLPLILKNETADGDLGVLTNLTLASLSITGPDAADFNIVGFTPTVLAHNDSLGITVEFLPTAAGSRQATLTLETDQGAPFGGTGLSFTFLLSGDGVIPILIPEPSAAVLFLTSMVALVICFLRRRSAIR